MQTTPTPLPVPAFITHAAVNHYDTFRKNIDTIFAMADIGTYSLDSIKDMAFSLPSAKGVIEYLGESHGILALRIALSVRMKQYIDSNYMPALLQEKTTEEGKE